MPYQLAFVTGATSGIGRAVCQLLARQKINLIATGRSEEQLQLLQDELGSQVDVQTISADLAQSGQRRRLIERLKQQTPDLVINNAGYGLYGEAVTYSTAEQMAILTVNGQAVLELTLEAAKAMRVAQKRGVIVNISSVAAFQVAPHMAVYAATKAFVNQFSQALDYELSPHGIRVLANCPGMVATQFSQRAGGISMPDNDWMTLTPDTVAQAIWKQIQHKTALQIVDWRYQFLTWLSYLIPARWTATVIAHRLAERQTTQTNSRIKK